MLSPGQLELSETKDCTSDGSLHVPYYLAKPMLQSHTMPTLSLQSAHNTPCGQPLRPQHHERPVGAL